MLSQTRPLTALMWGLLFVAGCDEPRAVAPPPVPTASDPKAPEASHDYIDQISELYEEAKAAGETTATNVSEWVSDVYGSASSTGATLARGTSERVKEFYEAAKERGETTAASTKDWVEEDLKRHGAWEYKTMIVDGADPEALVAQLNELGAERWNCFWVDERGDEKVLFLKRAGRSYLHQLPARELLLLMTLTRGSGGGPTE